MTKIEITIEEGEAAPTLSLKVDGEEVLPGPLNLPIQTEFFYQMILWHCKNRGINPEAVFYHMPRFKPAVAPPLRRKRAPKRSSGPTLTLADLGLT